MESYRSMFCKVEMPDIDWIAGIRDLSARNEVRCAPLSEKLATFRDGIKGDVRQSVGWYTLTALCHSISS